MVSSGGACSRTRGDAKRSLRLYGNPFSGEVPEKTCNGEADGQFVGDGGDEVAEEYDVDDDGGRGRNPDRGNAEGARAIGFATAEDRNGCGDDGEGDEGAGDGEVVERLQGDEQAGGGDEGAGDEDGDGGGAGSGVGLAEGGGEEAIGGHGEEDTALAHHHDEQDGGEADVDAEVDQLADGAGAGGKGGAEEPVADWIGNHGVGGDDGEVEQSCDGEGADDADGISRWGLRHSSPRVETDSKPR